MSGFYDFQNASEKYRNLDLGPCPTLGSTVMNGKCGPLDTPDKSRIGF